MISALTELRQIMKQPPRLGLVPQTGDWEHPGHWVLPEPEKEDRDKKVLSSDSIEAGLKRAHPISELSQDLLRTLFPDSEISGRVKTFESVSAKLIKQNIKAEDLTDIVGVRIHLNNLIDLPDYVQKIRRNFNVQEERDYNVNPKDYYRSYHIIAEVKGMAVEIQIRTVNQTKLADWAHNTLYKPPAGASPKVIEMGIEYARKMSAYYGGILSMLPLCPPAIKRWLTCLE